MSRFEVVVVCIHSLSQGSLMSPSAMRTMLLQVPFQNHYIGSEDIFQEEEAKYLMVSFRLWKRYIPKSHVKIGTLSRLGIFF